MVISWVSDWWPFVAAASVAVGGALAPLVRTFLERLVGFQFDRRMEDLRYDVKVREQAAKTAEYLATVYRLQATDGNEVYRRVNQLGWELALYLPADVYRHVRDAAVNNGYDRNYLTALIAVRTHLLGNNAEDLVADDIAFHAPNVKLPPSR